MVSAPSPLYLNFYRKLTMIAKPSIGKGGLFPVIDRCNICAAEQIWYDHVPRPIPSVAVW